MNKHCKVCEYWIRTVERSCFCCKNQYHSKRNFNPLVRNDQRNLSKRKRRITKKLPELENIVPITYYLKRRLLLVQEITTK